MLLWCCQNFAALRISARDFFASRGVRGDRGGMLCVVIRTLRLCVSLREIFLPHAECAEIAEVCFVVLSELCGSVLSARGSGCRGFRTISEVIDDAFDAVFKY